MYFFFFVMFMKVGDLQWIQIYMYEKKDIELLDEETKKWLAPGQVVFLLDFVYEITNTYWSSITT